MTKGGITIIFESERRFEIFHGGENFIVVFWDMIRTVCILGCHLHFLGNICLHLQSIDEEIGYGFIAQERWGDHRTKMQKA